MSHRVYGKSFKGDDRPQDPLDALSQKDTVKDLGIGEDKVGHGSRQDVAVLPKGTNVRWGLRQGYEIADAQRAPMGMIVDVITSGPIGEDMLDESDTSAARYATEADPVYVIQNKSDGRRIVRPHSQVFPLD
jgi:hypothetical protein